mmetsp:Transcript_16972/g.26984  ORF Transcript_16972/g.26984 Transcript_16972/m.26984 type:complete len:83 (+) Transcript_16972:164-412(+)
MHGQQGYVHKGQRRWNLSTWGVNGASSDKMIVTDMQTPNTNAVLLHLRTHELHSKGNGIKSNPKQPQTRRPIYKKEVLQMVS